MFKRFLAAAAVLTLVTAACGDDDDNSVAPPVETVDPGTGDPAPTPPDEGAGDEPATGGATVDVTMAFEPSTVEIQAGETVTWVSAGGLPHTVTSTSGPSDFDESLPDGGSVQVTFDEPGTHEYQCSIHPSMTGTVVVP